MEHMSQNVISSSAAIVLADPLIGHALTPQEVATAYDSYAADYDKLKGWKAAEILALDQARSYYSLRRVLEIGVGTGLNLEKYNSSKLESLKLVDFSQGMLG